ncbi:MAG: AIPR family protein [Blastocatellia bacterium]|nr:AIPR family protein [Blastocatellia bacterium]
MSNETIIRLQSGAEPHVSPEKVKLNKLVSSINAQDFIKLLKTANNKVNPRSAKKNAITESIQETLSESPELFWFKSKGMLLATERCEILERNRVRLSFCNEESEGIMDGGHNALAIASFIAEGLYQRSFKTWEECKQFWDGNFDAIVADFETKAESFGSFSIPIEVLYPNEQDGALDEYYDHVAEICSARNNNVQLTDTAKGNKIGLYDALKDRLDEQFNVIWKPGEAGNIKSDEVISMAAIPLFLLQEKGLLPIDSPQFNIIDTYRAKSKCISFYNAVLSHDDVSGKEQGKHVLRNSYIESGLGLVSTVMKFFDKVFAEFPKLYNDVSPGFGRIKSVDDKKSKQSLFRTRTCDKTYPPGFIYPLVTGIVELIEIDSEKQLLRWKIDPMTISLADLDMSQYIGAIKIANYDPQTVGKQILFYQQARSMFESFLRNRANEKTASAS